MSFATATTWAFHFILSLTWPALVAALRPQGAFGFYAAWNFFPTVCTYFLLPATKNRTLEKLDQVSSVGNRGHARCYVEKMPWYWNKWILRGMSSRILSFVRLMRKRNRGLVDCTGN
jgi:hypothetical protein